MASLDSPSRQQRVAARQSQALSRSALRASDALVLEHLPLADAIASPTARCLFTLVERGESDPGGPRGPGTLRSPLQSRRAASSLSGRCTTGALRYHLRDQVRLVRIPHCLHEQGQCPLGHFRLDASADGEPCLLDQLPTTSQATALRLTLQEGLMLHAAAEWLEISAMSVHRAQIKAIAGLRLHLSGRG